MSTCGAATTCQFVRPFSLRLHLVAAPRPHALLDRQFGEYGLRLQHGGIHRAAPTEYFTWNVRLGYYCDANAVCGVRCDEIDLMEASSYAFHSVAHQSWDGAGVGGGIGGSHGANAGYGPGGTIIDTRYPFTVSNTFSAGTLTSIRATLT